MELRKFAIIYLLVTLSTVRCANTAPYIFDFMAPTTTNPITFVSNDVKIELENDSGWLEIPQIPSGSNTRGSEGALLIGYNNQVSFNATLDFTGLGSTYYIAVTTHILDGTTSGTFFCIPAKVMVTNTDDRTPTWCTAFLKSGSSTTIFSVLYDTTGYDQYKFVFNRSISGWQFFGFKLDNPISGTTASVSMSINMFDEDGIFVSSTTPIETSSTTPYLINSGTIGYIDSVSDGPVHNLEGIIFRIGICSDPTICGDPTTDRATFISAAFTFYDNYWDLTTGTTYSGIQLLNPCLRSAEFGLANNYFYSVHPSNPIIATENGWINPHSSDSDIQSNLITFNSGFQFTIEFEVFPIDTYYEFYMYPYANEMTSDRLAVGFTNPRTYIYHPDTSSSAVRLSYKKWNRVFVTYYRNKIDDGFTVKVYQQVMSENAEIEMPKISQMEVSGTYSTDGFDKTDFWMLFHKSKIILKNVKFYKFAFAEQDIIDMGIYKEASDASYTFGLEFESHYTDHWTNDNLEIGNADNSCYNFFQTDDIVCAYLGEKKNETCQDGYELESYFCRDICGDGSVKMDPIQVWQCDDNNTISGDGCSSECVIEEYFQCEIITNLNNKSYCYTTCGNGIFVSTVEDCDDENTIDGDGCSSSCEIETGFKCDTSEEPSRCFPNCGDGIRDTSPTVEQCDDKNNLDFDGCSADCQVEHNYVCDNSSGYDICISLYFPPIVTSNVLDTAENTIMFMWNDTMIDYTLTEFDLYLDVSGPNSPYDATWTSTFDNNKLTLDYTVTPPIIGGVGESIRVQFVNVQAFKSIEEIPISSTMVFNFDFEQLEANEASQSASNGASYTFISTLCISIGISFLTGGSMELMWSLANTLQLIFFYGMLKLYYSSDLMMVFQFMSYSNFDNPLTQYVSAILVGGLNLINSPVSSEFNEVGFGSTDIVSNSIDKIIMVLLLIGFVILIALLAKCVKDSDTWLARKIKKMDKSFRYESMTRIIVELMLNLTVASLINITFGTYEKGIQIAAYILACVTLTCILYLTFYASIYPVLNYDKIQVYPDFLERHALLFAEFKKDKMKCLLFYSFFLIRRLLFAFIIVCLKDFIHIQLVCILGLCIWMVNYHIKWRPYKDNLQNFLSCFNELVLLTFSFFMFFLMSPDNPDHLMIFSYVCIGIIFAFFTVNWCIISVCMIFKMADKIRDWCHKKTPRERAIENVYRTRVRAIIGKPQPTTATQVGTNNATKTLPEIIKCIRPEPKKNNYEHSGFSKMFNKLTKEDEEVKIPDLDSKMQNTPKFL